MSCRTPIVSRAFTLIELLVVIAIIAVVAGLVVGLAAVVGERKKISRAQVERDKLVLLIESYKSKVGIYPPDHPANPGLNTLLYELAGAIRDMNPPSNPNYLTPIGDINTLGNIRSNVLLATYGIGGVINASEDPTDIDRKQFSRFLKTLKPDQFASLAANTLSLVVPIEGPNGTPNPWKYLTGTNAVHNHESFDLWVEIVVRNKTNTIGNWKD